MSIPISGWWWTHQGYQYRGGSHSSQQCCHFCPPLLWTNVQGLPVLLIPLTSVKLLCVQVNWSWGPWRATCNQAAYFPGYRTGCAPDSDTSCVAREQQRMHSLGLERLLVKTFVPPSSQLQVVLVSCSGEGSLGPLHIGHAVLPPASLCPGLGRVYYTTVHQ